MTRGDRRVNAKSIMGVMMLAAGLGSEVGIETIGEREQEAMDALLALIADRFGEGSSGMTFAIHGLNVSRGVAIGRAVLVASNRVDVAHYFIDASEVEAEIDRVRRGRNAVAENSTPARAASRTWGPKDAPHEVGGLARRAPHAAAG